MTVTADFTTSRITAVVGGSSIDFSDQSSGVPTSWLWDFGDGNTSTDQSPTNIYSSEGVYEVVLTSTGSTSDQIQKTVVVSSEIPRFMEIWGTVILESGYSLDTVDRLITTRTTAGVNYTDTNRVYRTIDDAGNVRFLVSARGHDVGLSDSGFEDGDTVYLYVGGRLATDMNGSPITSSFFQTLPSSPSSHIEIDIVFPSPVTTVTPAGGTYGNRTTIEMTSNVFPSAIFYTLDGSDPTTSGTRIEYTVPFELIEGTTELKFFTEDLLGPDEPVRTETYIIQEPFVVSSLPPADYSSAQEVTLTGNRPGTIYASIGGSPYSLYDGSPIAIEPGPSGLGTTVIGAYLDDTVNGIVGAPLTFIYNVDLVGPVITSFTINNGDTIASNQLITVQVDASSYTNSVTGLVLSEDPSFMGAAVQLYVPEVTFLLLPPDGIKTLYCRVSDQLEQFSSVKSVIIEMDTMIPTLTVSSSPVDPIGESTYEFTGTKSAGSGVLVRVTSGAVVGDEILQIPINDDVNWTHQVSLMEGSNTISFQSVTTTNNKSSVENRNVDVILIPEGVVEATTIASPGGVWRIPYVFFDEQRAVHDFKIIVEADLAPDPVITYPIHGDTLSEKVIIVLGTATPGSIVTLRVEEL